MAKIQYGSILFPFEENLDNNSLVRTTNSNDTLKSALKAFFLTRKGQRRGNSIGSLIWEYKHTLIPKEATFQIQDEVKQELNNYFRGVFFPVVTINQTIDTENNYSVPVLNISIQFGIPGKDLQELSISL
jgi:phage baseplate assembly protein W